jgi:hypothetical protein
VAVAAGHRRHPALRERQERESGTAVGPNPELIRYRIVAQHGPIRRTPALVVTDYACAWPLEEAVTKVRRALEKPGGLYGERGRYRVVEATEGDGPRTRVR